MVQPPQLQASAGQGPARVAATIAIVSALAACAAALYFFDPARGGYYPRCFFNAVTGLDCPGCGGLRAAHQLLRGNIDTAFAFNPLLVTFLPLAAAIGISAAVRRFQKKPPKKLLQNPRFAWALAAVVIAFGVLRNIPWRRFF